MRHFTRIQKEIRDLAPEVNCEESLTYFAEEEASDNFLPESDKLKLIAYAELIFSLEEMK